MKQATILLFLSLLATFTHAQVYDTFGRQTVDLGAIEGSAPSSTNPIPSRLTDGTSFVIPVLDTTVTTRFPAGSTPADNESNAVTTTRLGSFTFVFDGATWDRWTGAVTQAGTWNVTNISGTISLPTGAATAANQTTIIGHVDGLEALLTTIDTDTGLLAGAVSGTEFQTDVLVFPDNEPFDLNQLAGTALAAPFDRDTGGGTENLIGVNLRLGASGGSVEFGTASDPFRVDPTGTTTQPVSAASLPLPAGAATAANQTTIIGDVDGIEALLTTMDADTSSLAGTVSGSEQQVDVITSVLPTGAATAANQLAAGHDVTVSAITPVTATGSHTATGNTAIDVGGYSSVGLQLSGTWAATVDFEATVDGTNWQSIQGWPGSSATAATSSTANGTWSFPIGGYDQFRANVSAFTSGTVQVDLQAQVGAGKFMAAGGGGTQYTEDDAAAANPIGTATNLIRQDTPATLTSTDGDNVAQRGTNYGAAYTQIVTSSGSFVDSFGGSGGTAEIDEATYTPSTTQGTPAMYAVDETAPDSAAEGVVGIARMVPLRKPFAVLSDPSSDTHAAVGANGLNVDVQASALPTGAATSAGQLAAGHDVTVDNASGASAVNIQDGGNVITVDNGGTFVVQEDGASLTALQIIDDPVFVDDAPFTLASSSVSIAGGIRDDGLTTLTAVEGDAVPFRLTDDGAVWVAITPTGGNDVIVSNIKPDCGGDDLGACEDTIYPTAKTGIAVMLLREDTPTSTAADGDFIAQKTDSVGRTWVNPSGVTSPISAASLPLPTGAATEATLGSVQTAVEIMDDWDEVNRAAVNTISGQVGVQGGAGVSTALTQRVAIATDANTVILAANSGVDIGDVDILSIAAGTNNIGDVDVLSVVPGTAATNLGKAEDVASATGDTGVTPLLVRDDVPASTAGTDLDYIAPTANLWGHQFTTTMCEDPNLAVSVAIDTASSGNTELVALTTSDIIYVCGYDFVVDAAVQVQLIFGTGTACATGETNLTGDYSFAANGGMVKQGIGGVMKADVSEALCIELSAAVQVSGSLQYVKFGS